MPEIYLSVKSNEKAKEILKVLLEKCFTDVVAYECELPSLLDQRYVNRVEIVGIRKLSKRGGSYHVSIPSKLTRQYGLKTGDSIVFIKDRKTGKMMIEFR